MITKGTKEYKKAQEIANELKTIASYDRWNANTLYNTYVNDFYRFLNKIKDLGVFASKIAETIDKNFMENKNGGKVARMSDKQAWIIACATVENNIEFSL